MAESDAADAFSWYNNKREGLGEAFLLALDAKIHAIQRNPYQFPSIHRNVRRALTARFPYGLFFILEGQTIYILAIQHTRRDPKIWKSRQ